MRAQTQKEYAVLARQLRSGFREVRLARSARDVGLLLDKLAYAAPRVLNRAFSPEAAPPSLQLEPTNVCNAKCICCSAGKSRRKKGFIPVEFFRSTIDQAADIGVKRIHLFLHGEPLLHPKIVEMIAHIKAKGLSLRLTTNGMPLDPEKSRALLGTGLTLADHFVFSVLGHSAAVHEAVMPGVDHERVLSNILDLAEQRRRQRMNGPVIETVFYTMPENVHERKAFRDFWDETVDHARVVGKVSRLFADYHTSGNDQYVRTRTCLNIWERLTIYWNGDATLCCVDVDGDHVLGNVGEKSIAELWRSPKLLEIRRLHRQRHFDRIPICAHCDM